MSVARMVFSSAQAVSVYFAALPPAAKKDYCHTGAISPY